MHHFFGFIVSPNPIQSLRNGSLALYDDLHGQGDQLAGMANSVATKFSNLIDKISGSLVFQVGATAISLAAIFEGNEDPALAADELEEAIGAATNYAESSSQAVLLKMQLTAQEVNSYLNAGVSGNLLKWLSASHCR
jgi:hypothetical protein